MAMVEGKIVAIDCSLFSSSIPMLRISSIEFARQQQQQLMQYRISISTEPTEPSQLAAFALPLSNQGRNQGPSFPPTVIGLLQHPRLVLLSL
ncbi:hypothetical protein TYRP_017602 [Tyrophagus putrescentiae]|nr:hypothetical protein TYRP_017602 [Tyrophagus putrescentiae]